MSSQIVEVEEVPKPPSLKEFMVLVGPTMMVVALGLGTSELILYPRLGALYGVSWIGLLALGLFLQSFWAWAMIKWLILTGDDALRMASRIVGAVGAFLSITLLMFLAFVIPAWATAAASAFHDIVGFPVDKTFATVLWAYVFFMLALVFVIIPRTAKGIIEHVATWTTIIAWIIIAIAAIIQVPLDIWAGMLYHTFAISVPEGFEWATLGAALAWVGAGPTLIWYTYWARDSGWGLAKYAGYIPGLLRGGPATIRNELFKPKPTSENIARLHAWNKLAWVFVWIGYFFFNWITMLFIVGLSAAILQPRGLAPTGFEVVSAQALFLENIMGPIGRLLFLVAAWLLIWNTQITVAEALVRDLTNGLYLAFPKIRRWAEKDIRKLYFAIWPIYIAISFVLIALQYYVPGANPFAYVKLAALLSFPPIILSSLYAAIVMIKAKKTIDRPLQEVLKPNLLAAMALIAALYMIVAGVIAWASYLKLL